MENIETVITILTDELPPIFPRKMVGKLTYNLISPKTLANKDSEGKIYKWKICLVYKREFFGIS